MDKTSTITEVDRLHVFYDGGCPLCRREIQHYRRLASEKRIAWIDVERDVATLRHFGLQQAEALHRMHAYSPKGQWLIGVYAFLAIWRCIPRYRWAARCIQALGMDRPLQWLYQRWADRRFERARCAGRCDLPNP